MSSSGSSPVSPHISTSSYFYMLWASMAFATMGAVAHWAGEYCSWQLVAVARATVAFFVAFLIAKISGVRLIFWRPGLLWMRSIAGSIGMLCNFYALAILPVSDVLTLMNTTPIWVTLLLWLIFKQKPTVGIVLAVLISMAGIFLIQQPHFEGGKFACFLALIGAVCTSIAMLGLNRLHQVDPRAIVVHFSAISSITTCSFMLLTVRGNFFAPLHNATASLLLFLVGLSGVLGQIGMTLAFAKGHATRISIVGLSQIVFAIFFDVFIWHRSITLSSVIGMLLITAPTAWLLLSETPQQSHDVIEAEMS